MAFCRLLWLTAEADCVSIPDKTISAQKTSFDWSVKIARWLSTNGLKIFLQFYYSKTPVFALPADWFPYYVQWILSFPRAPLGSVSIQVWSNVCATTITVMAEVITTILLGSRTAQPVPADTNKKGQWVNASCYIHVILYNYAIKMNGRISCLQVFVR